MKNLGKSEIIGAMTIGAEHFPYKSNEHPQKYFGKFDQLSSSLEQIGAGYNRRVKKHMEVIHISSDFDRKE